LRPAAGRVILAAMNRPLPLLLTVALLALAVLARADAPSPGGGEAVVTHDFAALSFQEALALQGHRERYRVVLESLPDEVAGYVLYDCRSPVGESRTVYLLQGQAVEDTVFVEGVLVIRQMPPVILPSGTVCPGFTEYRLMDARR
jgi:hypothetical protein